MSTTIDDSPIGVLTDSVDSIYEIIDGNRVEKSMGIQQIFFANRLAFHLYQYAEPTNPGITLVEALFDFGDPMLSRFQFRPDLAFVSYQRWPRDKKLPSTNAWAVVPDLVVEVVSPSNSADDIQGKVDLYLKAGVRLAWVIYLKSACVHVFDGSATIRWVRLEGELDGVPVMPDFRLPLRTLFGGEVEPN